jgi:methionyl-tRNA formyltransferase
MNGHKIILLGGKGLSTRIVFHALQKRYKQIIAVVENPESKRLFLKRRVKRLGLWKVIGQVLFQVLVVKTLEFWSAKRTQEIITMNNLNVRPIPGDRLYLVSSVNGKETLELLNRFSPDLIIVNGSRIISRNIIGNAGCRMINIHAGITPKYRGVHGAYWALANKDPQNCGVTVHFVDEGIDTGEVISQTHITPSIKDNFVTYPLLQLTAGLDLLIKAIDDHFATRLNTQSGTKESFLWYHPTIWFYLYQRIAKRVR